MVYWASQPTVDEIQSNDTATPCNMIPSTTPLYTSEPDSHWSAESLENTIHLHHLSCQTVCWVPWLTVDEIQSNDIATPCNMIPSTTFIYIWAPNFHLLTESQGGAVPAHLPGCIWPYLFNQWLHGENFGWEPCRGEHIQQLSLPHKKKPRQWPPGHCRIIRIGWSILA